MEDDLPRLHLRRRRRPPPVAPRGKTSARERRERVQGSDGKRRPGDGVFCPSRDKVSTPSVFFSLGTAGCR
jgi:hypothetical protein